MTVSVQYWSFFRDLAATSSERYDVPEGTRVEQLLDAVFLRHPSLAPLRGCTRVAVGVEYGDPSQVLQPNDDVSLFPPVQGG